MFMILTGETKMRVDTNKLMTAHAVVCLLSFCLSSMADTVTGDESVKGSVQSISPTEVKMKEGKSLPLAKVKKIEFDSFVVAAKESGIILKDGTRLTGIFRETPDGQVFRSTTLGPIKLKTEDIAAIFYDSTFLPRLSDKASVPPFVIDRKGNTMAGKIMWSDTKSTGVKTSEGLKKVLIEDISIICYAAFKPAPAVLLRNGDIINLGKEFKGESMSVSLGDKKFDIPIKAIKEIIL